MTYRFPCWVLGQRSKAKLKKLDVGIGGPTSKASVQFRCVEPQMFYMIAMYVPKEALGDLEWT